MGARKNLLILGEIHSPSFATRPVYDRQLVLTRLREEQVIVLTWAQNRVAVCERDLQKAQTKLDRLQSRGMVLLAVAKKLSPARRDVQWAQHDLEISQHNLQQAQESLADIDRQLSELGGK